MDANKPESGMFLYRRLFRYASRYWPAFIIAVIAMAIYSTTDMMIARFMGELVETLKKSDSSNASDAAKQFSNVPLYFILLFLIRGVFGFLSTSGMSWIGRMSIYNIRKEMFNHMVDLPSSYYDKQTSGQLISKFTFNTEQVAQAITSATTTLIRDTLTAIILLAYLFYLDPSLTFILLVFGPVIIIFLGYLSRRFRRISKRIQNSIGDVTSVLQETIDGQKVVKIFKGKAKEIDQFDKVNRSNRNQNIKLMVTTASSVPLIQLLAAIPVSYIVYLLIQSDSTPGEVISYMTAMLLILAPLKRLTSVTATLQKGLAAASGIFDVLDEATERDTGRKTISSVKGKIEYDNIGFSYTPDRKAILSNISFVASPGETIAIIGRSGGGKSSLVNLLPRFYDYSDGRVLIDGVEIKEYTLDSLRDQISIVSQHVTLFNDSIANNIAYGSLKKTKRADIIEVAEAAHVMEFIKHFDQGLDTQVGEGGGRLSGGQRQRIAIARAILKDAPILILDEATSALDAESKQLVQDGVEKLRQGRTTLVIAHQLSTVENADQILVVDKGEIIEAGTHPQLLQNNGVYSKLYHNKFNEKGSE